MYVETGSTTGSITTGTFTFDQPTMEGLIKKWVELVDSYDRSLRDNVPRMTGVQGPGLDFASRAHAEAANRSGESYRDYITHCREYAVTQAQQFQNALDDYLGMEHRNVLELHQSQTPPSDGPTSGI